MIRRLKEELINRLVESLKFTGEWVYIWFGIDCAYILITFVMTFIIGIFIDFFSALFHIDSYLALKLNFAIDDFLSLIFACLVVFQIAQVISFPIFFFITGNWGLAFILSFLVGILVVVYELLHCDVNVLFYLLTVCYLFK